MMKDAGSGSGETCNIAYGADISKSYTFGTHYDRNYIVLNFRDDSKAIEGKLGEYAVIARPKGDVWYIAGMADWNGKKVSIDLSKILDGGDYEAEIIRDSVNSNIVAADYKRETKTVSSSDVLEIEMKNGGGFAMKLKPKKFLWIF